MALGGDERDLTFEMGGAGGGRDDWEIKRWILGGRWVIWGDRWVIWGDRWVIWGDRWVIWGDRGVGASASEDVFEGHQGVVRRGVQVVGRNEWCRCL